MEKLLIIGASGHGKVVAEIAELSNSWSEIAFIDDNPNAFLKDYQVLGSSSLLEQLQNQYLHAFVAIGNNQVRLSLINRLQKLGYKIPVLVHPKSIVSTSCSISSASVVMAGAVINPDCKIGTGCIINTGSTIDHDCTLEDGVHVSPGAHLAGTVHVGKASWVCLGANIINNTVVGVNSVVAAGATVISNVPDNVLVAGTPAKIKKHYLKNA